MISMIFIAAFVAVIYLFSRNVVRVQTHRDNIVSYGLKTKIPEAGD